jgi:hypothetical protein
MLRHEMRKDGPGTGGGKRGTAQIGNAARAGNQGGLRCRTAAWAVVSNEEVGTLVRPDQLEAPDGHERAIVRSLLRRSIMLEEADSAEFLAKRKPPVASPGVGYSPEH